MIGDKCLVIAHKVLGQLGMPAPYRTASTSLAADLCREQNTLTDDLLLYVQTNIPKLILRKNIFIVDNTNCE